MTRDDAVRWDERYQDQPESPPAWPDRFAAIADVVPADGHAMDIACGTGSTALFLASRGLNVVGLDVSSVAITAASRRATELGLDHLARFEVVDLDDGLPDGPPLALATCHLFRDARLDDAIVERLAPGGLLAIAITVLSQVGLDGEPGPFHAPPGELVSAFREHDLQILRHVELDGEATLVARRPA